MGCNRPSINHTLLSPSGHCSKRARLALLKIEHDRLFPPGFWDDPAPTTAEEAAARVLSLRRSAADLRDLAGRGMSTKKFQRAALRLEIEADDIESRTEQNGEVIR